MSKSRVLVVGGSGYLGQHLLQGLSSSSYDVAFTHHSFPPQPLLDAIPHSLAFPVDLITGQGFDQISLKFGQPHVVVNCAAISVPRDCEKDPDAAMCINVPSALVNWLSTLKDCHPLLIHLSTDQVYEGIKSFYKEDDEAVPVNVYGKSKVAAEKFISEKYSNYAILRTSIIIGPQTVAPIPKTLPIQWIDSVLSKGAPVDFFHDEFRCPVYVKDVVAVILTLTNQWISEKRQMQLLLNVCGPDRLSRAQMAETVADIRGHSASLVKSVSASTVDRGVKSPPDISMDISKLGEILGFSPTPYREAVRLTFESAEARQETRTACRAGQGTGTSMTGRGVAGCGS
ncbi:hypothetical protein ACFE04_026719 [Oxalis oulophora]